jgi:hypothetical protein
MSSHETMEPAPPLEMRVEEPAAPEQLNAPKEVNMPNTPDASIALAATDAPASIDAPELTVTRSIPSLSKRDYETMSRVVKYLTEYKNEEYEPLKA